MHRNLKSLREQAIEISKQIYGWKHDPTYVTIDDEGNIVLIDRDYDPDGYDDELLIPAIDLYTPMATLLEREKERIETRKREEATEKAKREKLQAEHERKEYLRLKEKFENS